MATDSLKSFTMIGIISGLLITCLLTFSIQFMYYNNPGGLGSDTDHILESAYDSQVARLSETPDNADVLLNITSNTNPEVSDLGSRDSVATSYSATGTGKGSFESAKELIGWVFTGTTGTLILTVFGGIIGILTYFFIYKHIRQGGD